MCLLQLQLLLTPRESIFSSISLSLTAGGAISRSLEESQTGERSGAVTARAVTAPNPRHHKLWLGSASSDTATRYNAMLEGGALKPDQGLVYFSLSL